MCTWLQWYLESTLPLIEFSYNNSYQETIGVAPYKALYGRKCRSPLHWYEIDEIAVTKPEFIESTTNIVKKIQARMKCLARAWPSQVPHTLLAQVHVTHGPSRTPRHIRSCWPCLMSPKPVSSIHIPYTSHARTYPYGPYPRPST